MPIVLVTPALATPTTTTPGIVGTTSVDTATLLEHAFRRVKIHPSAQTPELVDIALKNLYLVLMTLVNRGLNLWCVQSDFIGLANGKAVYDTPLGTVDVLEVIYCRPTRATGTNTITTTSITTALASPVRIVRTGVKFSTINATDTVTIQASNDGITWTTLNSLTGTDWTTDTWYWFNPDVVASYSYYRAVTLNTMTASEFYLASNSADLPVIQWNRDTWSVINNKAQTGSPATNYYLERLLTPRITLWPVPNNNFDHLQVFSQRQIQDVGTLTQQIEVPQRWIEAVIWQLSMRLSFEVPQVDAAVIQVVSAMADRTLLEVEREETDGAPISLQPNVSVYTR